MIVMEETYKPWQRRQTDWVPKIMLEVEEGTVVNGASTKVRLRVPVTQDIGVLIHANSQSTETRVRQWATATCVSGFTPGTHERGRGVTHSL